VKTCGALHSSRTRKTMATILVQIIVSCSVLPENDTLLLGKQDPT